MGKAEVPLLEHEHVCLERLGKVCSRVGTEDALEKAGRWTSRGGDDDQEFASGRVEAADSRVYQVSQVGGDRRKLFAGEAPAGAKRLFGDLECEERVAAGDAVKLVQSRFEE